jgi:hypothetical protein
MRTVASLRPRLEGWEVFAEVHCSGGPTQHHALVVAGANGTHVVVRGDGSVEDADALIASLGPDAAVEFRAFSDRFRVSFALPRGSSASMPQRSPRSDFAESHRKARPTRRLRACHGDGCRAPCALICWRDRRGAMREARINGGRPRQTEPRADSVYSPA